MDIKTLNLEQFNEVGSKFSRRISITRTASFGFPPAFLSENNITDPQYVAVFYDQTQNVIGLKFLGATRSSEEKEQKKSFKLSFNNSTGSASFGARSFFSAYHLNPEDIKGRYDFEKINYNDLTDIYVIDLNLNKDHMDE